MNTRRRRSLFVGALTLCGAFAVGEAFLTYERWSESRSAKSKLEQRKAELLSMADYTPPPTREVAALIEEDLARARAALASMQAELKGHGPAAQRLGAAKVPAARTDAYFDLATFVEKMRELARKNDVVVRPEAARFGFATYANEGPEAERIEPVFRQRLIAQYLVEALLTSQPRALLAIKREAPLTDAERVARDAAVAALANGEAPPAETNPPEEPQGADYFSIDPRVTARAAGFIDATAFRFVFTGETAALRAFLTRLASFELPVLVREVEVEPALAEDAMDAIAEENPAAPEPRVRSPAATPPSVVLTLEPDNRDRPARAPKGKSGPAPTSRGASPIPIVPKPLSRFTVTVEFIELVAPAAPNGDGATAPSS